MAVTQEKILIRRGNKSDLVVGNLQPGEPVLCLDTDEAGIKTSGGSMLWAPMLVAKDDSFGNTHYEKYADGRVHEWGTYEKDNFRLTADVIKSLITPKTKAIVFCYPNNPTGAVMEEQDLREIAEVLRQHNILVISDEVYAELVYGIKHTSIASLPGMAERTLVINGFSKAFAMTGWRLGFACGPKELMDAMKKIHQYVIMCAPTMSQWAAIEALDHGMPEVERMVAEYNRRREVIVGGFRSMGLSCFEPKGAFYCFPRVSDLGMSSDDFCTQLLESEKVAVVPGSAFGASGEGFIRCSYAYSVEAIEEALRRIERFIQKKA